MVYQKSLHGNFVCSWNCGFEHKDIEKVAEHEAKGHLGT